MDQPKLTINPNTIRLPLLQVIKECNDSVLFGLRMVNETESLTEPSIEQLSQEYQEVGVKVVIGEDEKDIKVSKQNFKDWLIKKGFEDIIKGINLSVIESYFQIKLHNHVGKTYKIDELTEIIQKLKQESLSQSNFPQLIKEMGFEDNQFYESIKSINRVRNCLVHRNGFVTKEKDFNDKENQQLVLEYWSLELVYLDENNKETEEKENKKLGLLNKQKKISFKEGEKIKIGIKDFNGCLLTCQFFVEQLSVQTQKKFNEFHEKKP